MDHGAGLVPSSHSRPVGIPAGSGSYKAAWRVIGKDPELLLVPFIGFGLVVLLSPLVYWAWKWGFEVLFGVGREWVVLLVLIVPMAWLLFMVLAFLESLIVVTAHRRIHGGSPLFMASLGTVLRRIHRLVAYSVLMALAVGLSLLPVNKIRGGWLVASAAGLGLSVATMFVIPHLMLTRDPVRSALQASGSAIRDRFDQATRDSMGFGVVPAVLGTFSFFASPVLGMAIVLLLLPHFPGVSEDAWFFIGSIPFLLALLFVLYSGVAWAIYKTVLYEWVVHGRRVKGFPEGTMRVPLVG